MDKFNFNQTGGFPLTTDILNAMQQAYNIFNSLGSLAGNYTIISGCVETGNNVSAGVVYINGELLPFKGGAKISKVKIVEVTEQAGFEDGTKKTVLFKRYVQFGTGVNAIEWRIFKRPDPLLALSKKMALLEEKLKKTVPVGLVAIWDRPASDIPEGWEEHTEMRGKKPLAYNPNDSDYSVLGKNIGKKSHTITEKNLPKIQLKWKKSIGVKVDSWNGRDNLVYSDKDYHWKHKESINRHPLEDIGNTNPTAISNLDPSRIVRFIRFVGFN